LKIRREAGQHGRQFSKIRFYTSNPNDFGRKVKAAEQKFV